VVFDKAYSKEISTEDAPKLGNPGANFSIETKGKLLAIEGTEPLADNSIVQFRMWNLLRQDYTLEFVVTNVNEDGISAVLEDAYLKTSTALNINATTVVNFAVDGNAGSTAAGRFRIVFSKTNRVPIAVNEYVIAPNPVENRVLNLQFKNRAAGKYNVNIRGNEGKSIIMATITHSGGAGNYQVALPLTLASGAFQIEIVAPDKTKAIRQLIVNNK